MSKNNAATNQDDRSVEGAADEGEVVSLGPACGIVALFVAVAISMFFTVAAYMLMQRQDEAAVTAIQTQLIPWVEQSALAKTDRDRIVGRLNNLMSQIEAGEIDEDQLRRLHRRLTQNTTLQWAPIEAAILFAERDPSFSEAERQQLQSISDQLLALSIEGQLAMEEFEYLQQPIAVRENPSGRLIVRDDLDHTRITDMMTRAVGLLRRMNFDPAKARERSVAQAFDETIDLALEGDK